MAIPEVTGSYSREAVLAGVAEAGAGRDVASGGSNRGIPPPEAAAGGLGLAAGKTARIRQAGLCRSRRAGGAKKAPNPVAAVRNPPGEATLSRTFFCWRPSPVPISVTTARLREQYVEGELRSKRNRAWYRGSRLPPNSTLTL